MFDEDYGRGRGNLLFNEYGVSVQEDGKILKTDGGEVCKTVCEESIQLNCTYNGGAGGLGNKSCPTFESHYLMQKST